MESILQQLLIDKNSIYHELNEYLQKIDTKEIVDILNNINKYVLYSSYFHGLHHSQKVCLFTYLICKELKINDIDTKILIDAALYHDIGRLNDFEEQFHGYNSARNIDSVVKDELYKDEANLLYLKALCEAHSLDDSKMKDVFENYKYENPDLDFERFKILCSILKDADALDRTRFRKTSIAALSEKYLRLDYSKTLIDFSNLINNHFYFTVAEYDYQKEKDKYNPEELKCGCFHGIGFDFFKLESILKKGILSHHEAIKQNVDMVRNFNGNNKSLWISVVPFESVSQDGKAYNRFIKKGISFFAFVPELKNGTNENSSYNQAHNSGEYDDESFVFNSIPLKNIHSIIVFKDSWDKNISELDYLHGANNYDIICSKIESIISNIKKSSKLDIESSRVNKLLDKYRELTIDFEKKSITEQKNTMSDFFVQVDSLVYEINKEVQKWMLNYYKILLNIDSNDIKVSDVVRLIFRQNNIVVKDVEENETQISFILNPVLKKEEEKDKQL